MRNYIQNILLLLVVMVTMTSCDAIGAIFDAGLAIGVIGTLLVIGIIVMIVRGMKK